MAQDALKAMQDAEAILKEEISTYDVQKLVRLLGDIGGIEVFNKKFKEMVDKELKSKCRPIVSRYMGGGWREIELKDPHILLFRNSSETHRGMEVKLTNSGIKIAPTYDGKRVDKYTRSVEITISYDKLDEGLPSAIAKLNELFSAIDSYLESHRGYSVTNFVAYSGCKLLEELG